MTWRRLRLLPRFVLVLGLLAVLPVFIVGQVVLRINSSSLQFEVQRYHHLLATSLANSLDVRLTTLETQLSMAIATIRDSSIGIEEKQRILGALLDASPHLAILSVLTGNGQEVMKVYNPTLAPDVDKNPSLQKHRDLPLYKEFEATRKETIDVALEDSNLLLHIYIPFESPTARYALYSKVSLNDIRDEINEKTIGKTGVAVYVGKNGSALTSPPRTDRDPPIELDASIVKTALIGSETAREYTDRQGVAWIGAAAPVSKLGGAIITRQKRHEAFSKVLQGQRNAWILLVLTMVLAIGVAVRMARSLAKPLLAITSAVKMVDLDKSQFPPTMAIKSGDEIEEMATTINEMIQKLKRYSDIQVERLIIEQKKTEAIIFSIEDGIIMTDYQGKIQLINNAANSILNLPNAEETHGQALWKYLPSAELKTAFIELLTKSDEKKSIQVKIPMPERNRYYALSTEPVLTPNKQETLGIVTVIHDITLEKELDLMKDEFLHSITHDLRNPLTAIRGFIRLFQSGQSGPITDLQRKMMDTMDRASLRLLTMVNDILDLARMEAGRLTLHLEPVSVQDTAARIIELFSPQARGNSINMHVDMPNGPPPPVTVDNNLIERVFTNLIGNALKFTPDNGAITVRLEDGPDMIRCTVEDTGEGIPENYLDKIFDKFKQVEGRFKGGAGLGLTICKSIIEAHGGKIWVESVLNKGSSFIFLIPRTLVVAEEKAA